jgi:cation transport ATPase
MAAAVAAREFQVGAVMLARPGHSCLPGQALEEYGVRRARQSLSQLADRIPRLALVVSDGEEETAQPIEEITIGSTVLVRHGEVLPQDGELLSERALCRNCAYAAKLEIQPTATYSG